MIVLHVDVARPEQARAIANLVNAAYRPGSGTAGWTHESTLVSGARTEAGPVRDAMRQPGTVILVACVGPEVQACVQLEREGEICHLGMLAVDPARQGSGLGKALMAHAERHALEQMGCATIGITVLSQRPELLSFYVRRGFRPTGTVMPYPCDAGVGMPVVEGLSVETLEKSLLGRFHEDELPSSP